MNNVVTSRLPASVLGSMTVAIRVVDIVVFSFRWGEFAVAASNNSGGGCLTGVMDRFPGSLSVNTGAAFKPPFEIGFLLDIWLNAKAWVVAEVGSGSLGMATCRVAFTVVGIFSDSKIREADPSLFFDGDGVTEA